MPGFVVRVACLFVSLWCGVVLAGETQVSSRPAVADPSAPVDAQSGESYPAGTRLLVPKGRASFLVPVNWHAQAPEDSEAIVLISDSGAGFVMVFMILNTTEEELMTLLGEPQPLTHDLVFEPAGPAVKKGNRMTASYEAGSLSGRALAVMGPEQGVLFFLGRPRTDSVDTDRVLADLADSTEFASPQ